MRGRRANPGEALPVAPPSPDERLGQTIAETLADRLQQFVTELAPGFEPGRRLDVEAIATRFGVSATPVKQALKRLEERGLVEIRPRRGHFVTQLSDLDVREIMATRSALEQAAIRICRESGLGRGTIERIRRSLEDGRAAVAANDVEAYRAADFEFHHAWIDASKNRRLTELYNFLLAQAKIVYVYIPNSDDDIAISLAEHEELLAIAERHDLAELENGIDRHWKNSVERAIRRYQNYIVHRVDSDSEEMTPKGSRA